jgi:chromosome partitioning protein
VHVHNKNVHVHFVTRNVHTKLLKVYVYNVFVHVYLTLCYESVYVYVYVDIAMIIAIVSSKGGVGKSTTACALAVEAARRGLPTALMDANADQGSATLWFRMRAKLTADKTVTMLPLPDDLANIKSTFRKSAATGIGVIDGQPVDLWLAEHCIVAADVVLIPARASPLDFAAVQPVAALCKACRKPYRVLLAMPDNRQGRINAAARAQLGKIGPVIPESGELNLRYDHVLAMAKGRTAAEIEPDKNAAEVAALFDALMEAANGPA